MVEVNLMNQILIEKLNELKNIHIIDIRSQVKYEEGHILNAINIPKNNLMSSPDAYLSKDTKYYIYCDLGIISREVCVNLDELGYDVINLIGGYKRWLEANK